MFHTSHGIVSCNNVEFLTCISPCNKKKRWKRFIDESKILSVVLDVILVICATNLSVYKSSGLSVLDFKIVETAICGEVRLRSSK